MAKMKSGGVTSMDMKLMGRNAARAVNQSGRVTGPSTGSPFKTESSVKVPKPEMVKKNVPAPQQAIVAVDGSPKKATKIRGTGAATKGTMARGPMG